MASNNTTESTIEEFFTVPAADTSIPTWKRLQQGDSAATSDYLTELQPTIVKAVNIYAQGDKAYSTQARIMALAAAKTYDPSKGTSISTHVMNQLRPLQRLAAQRGNLTKLSENVAQQRSAVSRAIRELTAELGDEPTTAQIADYTGFSTKRIDALMNYRPVVADSAAVNPNGDSFVAHEPDRALTLYDTVIYNELDDTDKTIYEWSTGYGKGERLSGTEIARKLKISPAAVSKRYAKIASKFAQDRELIRRTLNVETK